MNGHGLYETPTFRMSTLPSLAFGRKLLPQASSGFDLIEKIRHRQDIYTVDPIYRGAWGPSSATAIYPDRDISWGGSLLRRR